MPAASPPLAKRGDKGGAMPPSQVGSAGVTAEEGLAAVELAERVTNAIREQDWGKALNEQWDPRC